MANIVEVIRKYVRPYYYHVLVLVLVLLFVYVGRYVFNKYMSSENFDVANDPTMSRENGVVVYFFHADWCPHCKKAKPEWDGFKSTNDGKVVNGYKVSCMDIDCTDENDAKSNQYINKFGIDSYPTIKLVKDDKTIDFESRITTTSLNSFLDTMLDE
jgi:thiol-disulfide isomerase/thioredoxin